MSVGVTLGILFNHVVQRLESGKDPGSAHLDARIILSFVMDVGPEIIVAYPERTVDADQANAVWSITFRRAKGEPMAAILGVKEFWGRDFKVSADVLIPRPDTETLIDTVLQMVPDHGEPMRILDIGTGSGCILLTLLKEYPLASGVGTDLSPAALAIARENAVSLGVSGRVSLVETSYASDVDGAFDVLVSNPPYIPTGDIATLAEPVRGFEPHLALDGGEDGLVAYRELARIFDRYVLPGGWAFLETGFDQARNVADLFANQGHGDSDFHCDLGGIERVVSVRCQK